MTTLTIRGLPDATIDALRLRAAANRRSLEGELRALLTAAAEGKAIKEALAPHILAAIAALDGRTREATEAELERLADLIDEHVGDTAGHKMERVAWAFVAARLAGDPAATVCWQGGRHDKHCSAHCYRKCRPPKSA